MKTTPIIGQRTLIPENSFGVNSDVIVAHKQKLRTPGGKKEKVIVFSRVPQSQIKLDKTGETKRAAKLAVTIMQERLEKRGVPPATIDRLMSTMYMKIEGKMETDKNAFDGHALDALIEKRVLQTGKVRFADDDKQIVNKPIPSAPLPTTVNLPELPDSD
jgi:hypothetical protein